MSHLRDLVHALRTPERLSVRWFADLGEGYGAAAALPSTLRAALQVATADRAREDYQQERERTANRARGEAQEQERQRLESEERHAHAERIRREAAAIRRWNAWDVIKATALGLLLGLLCGTIPAFVIALGAGATARGFGGPDSADVVLGTAFVIIEVVAVGISIARVVDGIRGDKNTRADGLTSRG